MREWARAHEITEYCYIEFGVLNGESMVDAIRQLRGGLRSVVGFDTFAGIPELAEGDRSAALAPSFAQGAYDGMSRDDVARAVLAATDFPCDRLNLISGDFRVSLPGTKLDAFPLCAHLDCDIYSSSAAALEWVAEVAQDGTWLLADDYWTYRGSPKFGQRRAIREVLESHPRIEATPYCNYRGFGRAFILNVK